LDELTALTISAAAVEQKAPTTSQRQSGENKSFTGVSLMPELGVSVKPSRFPLILA
jgi:hypothetical protein